MLENETLILFNELPRHLPKRNGKRLSLTTLYRWRSVGLCGVRLEIAYVGGQPHTSLEALARFNKQVTEAKLGPRVVSIKSTPKQVALAHAKAKRRLNR